MGGKLFTQRTKDVSEIDVGPADVLGRQASSSRDALEEVAELLLRAAKTCEEQKTFWEQWLDVVFRPACANAMLEADGQPEPFYSLTVCTDLAALEISVTLGTIKACELAREFLESCHLAGQQDSPADHMEHVVTALGCRRTTLWCRLKHMGSDSPSLDTGFHVDVAVPWIVADILMPPNADQELLRKHALQELLTPCGYGCSILPVEPESYLDFECRKAAGANRGNPSFVNAGLFFFKALEFVMPEVPTIKAISNLFAMGMVVRCSMGLKGITRLSMIALEPLQPDAKSLATSVSFAYSEQLQSVNDRLGTQPASVHFAAEERGYTVSVGFKN
mmetsp:Transcript_98748/g.313365  ORF Transcript_98748/g.313365 Transcript_98748/m.313365 type:complete len:334 (-) Transcript_98748:41-1042(-)